MLHAFFPLTTPEHPSRRSYQEDMHDILMFLCCSDVNVLVSLQVAYNVSVSLGEGPPRAHLGGRFGSRQTVQFPPECLAERMLFPPFPLPTQCASIIRSKASAVFFTSSGE